MGKNVITIDLTGASEVARIWLSELFRTEIDEVEGTIDNETIWASVGDNLDGLHRDNISELEEYKEILNKALDDVEGREN